MKLPQRFACLVLLGCAAFAVSPLERFVSANTGAVSALPTPTSTPLVKPLPLATSIPALTPSPTPFPVQTLADLQSKIRTRMLSPDARRGRVGIKIVSLNSGKIIFENDSEKYFMPASNMKNFTVATAMERLGPDFKFVTKVYANAAADSSGTVKGSLIIKGGGDISISNAFDPLFPKEINPYWGIDRLADKIVAAGVKRVEGDIVGDESYFHGFAIPATWEWDDLQSYYGTEISALPLNDNAVDVSVIPGSAGNQCIARISPPNQIMRIVNKCLTNTAGLKRDLRISKKIDQNVIEIGGTIPAGDAEYRESVAFTHPAELFVALLKERLLKKGVTVTGRSRILEPGDLYFAVTNGSPTFAGIAQLQSPPFSVIAAKTMKPSQNMYTETILWTLGEVERTVPRKALEPSIVDGFGGQIRGLEAASRRNSSEIGLNVVKSFLIKIGIPSDGIVQYDGSGLSRHDLITPSAVVTLYSYMAKQSKYSQAWRDSLTIGGVDGTLKNRFKGTAAQGNIRGKTGTIDQVSALSGYLTTASGEQIIISIVVNGVPVQGLRTSLIDDIVVNLANFNGKIDQ